MIQELPKHTPEEILDKVNPHTDPQLSEAYKDGFKKAWYYKEQERRGWEASSKLWRYKFETLKNGK